MKILNLYSGIGGNRKHWGTEHEITAVEINENIAKIYSDYFPNDKVIIADAHNYLLEHFNEYDFIWSSPPCPSHSRARKQLAVKIWGVQNKPIYPEMTLYQEILFLQGYFKGRFVVENVISWYEPLVKPIEVNNHYFWANFNITKMPINSRKHHSDIDDLQLHKGFNLSKYSGVDKRKLLRNCVEPNTGLHILNCAFNKIKDEQIKPGCLF